MLFNTIGWIGAIIYIIAYFLVSIRKLHAEERPFHILNFFGAIGVTTAAIYNDDTPSIVLNVAWGVIAFLTMTRSSKRKK